MARDFRKFLLLSVLALGFVAEPALQQRSTAHAQDDWGVRRDPFDKELIARYKRILSKKPSDTGALSKLMGMYRRYRSVGLLIREYQAALDKKPSFANHMVLGYLHQHEGNSELAREFFAKAAQRKPKDAQVHRMLGQLARDTDSPNEAERHYRLALANSSKKGDQMRTLRSLADLALKRGQIDDAKGFFERYIKLDPKNLQIQLELGDALVQFKRYDDAIQIFKGAESRLRSDPVMRVEVVGRIGNALEGKGDDMAAIGEYERGIKLAGRGYYLVKELTVRTIEIHRRRQQLPALIAKLEKTWKPRRRGHFEWDTLARLYEESGLSDQAIEAYRKATKKAPFELDTQRRLIVLLDNSGLESQALKQYETVIRVAPGEPRFQLELAQRYWKLGEAKKAMATAKKIESRFSGDAGVVGSLADLYDGWDKQAEALAAYQKLTRIEPGDARHLENLGEQYHQRGDKKKASQVWKKIIRVPSAESYARLARVYSEHDLLHDGLLMYDKAIRLEPKQAALYKGRANVYERLRRLDKAIADWESVLALTPDKMSNKVARREARRRVVGLLRRPGHNRKTRLATRQKQWVAAFAETPPKIGAGYYLVEIYTRLGQLQAAESALERLRSLRPGDPSVMEDLVDVYRSNSKPDEAIALLLELAQRTPGRERDYFNQIAEIKTDLQQDGEAIEYARRALDKSPNDPVAYQRLAERYQAMQKQDEAISAYEKSIELAPRSFRVYFTLARLYINRGERHKAALLYREILEKASNQETLHKAGQEAVELEWLAGTLGELERRIAPLVVGRARKPIYRRLLVQLYGRYVPDLAVSLNAGDAKNRKAAAKELARLGTHGLRPLLAALADEQDIQQQQIAVAVLGYLGNHGAAAPLVRLARTEIKTTESKTLIPTIDMKLRFEALVAAGRLGDPRTIPDLIALSTHQEYTLRQGAIFALGNTRDRRALPALFAATKDPRDSVKTLACLALEGIKAPSIAPKAIAIVKDESRNDNTRAACAWLLGHRKETSAKKALAEALAHGNDQTQRLAAWALGRLGDKSALPALLEAYYTKRDPVRSAAVLAIKQVLGKREKQAPKAARPYIASFPTQSHGFDEERAILDLTEVPATRTPFDPNLLVGQEKELALALRSAITRYRDLVLRALAELDARDEGLALGALTSSMTKLPPVRRRALEKTLTAVGQDLLPELAELTQHRDPEVRRRSLNVLAKIGGEQPMRLLNAALSDTNSRVRKASMQSAARLARLHPGQGRELADAVAQRLTAKHWQERVAAATALAQWPQHGKSEELAVALVSDEKGFVRSAAARALSTGMVRTPAIYAALAKAGSHEHESLEPVRSEAVRALQALGGGRAAALLKHIRSTDPSPRVRQLANDPK